MDTFHTYFKALTKAEREAFAAQVGTSVAYLWQIAYKQRRCAESLAIEIEKASRRAVKVEDLRPDVDWAYVRSSAQSIADSEFQGNGVLHSSAAEDDAQNNPGGTVRKTKQRKKAV
ncbi:YdaS family helix-turn-helix protein [Paraburkholderia fungorum]|uniref:transcriptional regulator n=1 Tax=Paraburkholderia fungorum TaxID=134537 RepID=UPI0038B8A88A